MNDEDITDRQPTLVFLHRGVTWVPHYHHQHTYVAPGGAMLHRSYLILYRSVQRSMQLWPVPWAAK